MTVIVGWLWAVPLGRTLHVPLHLPLGSFSPPRVRRGASRSSCTRGEIPAGPQEDAQKSRSGNAWWQSHASHWARGGSGVVDVKNDGLVTLLVQLWNGLQSIATHQGFVPLLESALGGYAHHG